MKLIKMRRSGELREVSDKVAKLYVDLLHVAVYENLKPVVKKPIPAKPESVFENLLSSAEESETSGLSVSEAMEIEEKKRKRKRTYKRRDMKAEGDKQPKKRQYRRRNSKAEEAS